MRDLFTMAIIAAASAIADAATIIMPPGAVTGQDIAVVWIHGMDCENTAYQSIASQV